MPRCTRLWAPFFSTGTKEDGQSCRNRTEKSGSPRHDVARFRCKRHTLRSYHRDAGTFRRRRMAKIRPGDAAALAPVSRRLTPPGVFLLRMLIFLTLVSFLVAILFDQLQHSFLNNPGLNGLIVGTLFLGIVYAFRQVVRLYPEIRWVNAFRIADPGLTISAKPVLLAPMATMLRDRTGAISLSTSAMRSFMDSIGSRLDEARDTGRYLV